MTIPCTYRTHTIPYHTIYWSTYHTIPYTWADLNHEFLWLRLRIFCFFEKMQSVAVRAREHAQVEERALQIFIFFFLANPRRMPRGGSHGAAGAWAAATRSRWHDACRPPATCGAASGAVVLRVHMAVAVTLARVTPRACLLALIRRSVSLLAFAVLPFKWGLAHVFPTHSPVQRWFCRPLHRACCFTRTCPTLFKKLKCRLINFSWRCFMITSLQHNLQPFNMNKFVLQTKWNSPLSRPQWHFVPA